VAKGVEGASRVPPGDCRAAVKALVAAGRRLVAGVRGRVAAKAEEGEGEERTRAVEVCESGDEEGVATELWKGGTEEFARDCCAGV
jgi:hypothetical protein